MNCKKCGNADIIINTFEESKAGCGGCFNWIFLIIIGIIAMSTGFIVIVLAIGLIYLIVTAASGGLPALMGISKKPKTICVCKSCGKKWEI